MPETPDDPLLPGAGPGAFDAPLAFAPVPGVEEDPLRPAVPSKPSGALPFEPAPAAQPGPAPMSLVPDSVRQRAAADLPFALAPGGFSTTPFGGASDHGLAENVEGIPTGLPDLRALAGIEVPASPSPPAPAPAPQAEQAASSSDLPEALDDDLMALPSPSMVEPSPFADEGEDVEDDEPASLLDDVVLGHVPTPHRGLHEDETETEQMPPTPIGVLRRDAAEVVPVQLFMDALAKAERRHVIHLGIAFCLGAASSVVGFVAARWALVNSG